MKARREGDQIILVGRIWSGSFHESKAPGWASFCARLARKARKARRDPSRFLETVDALAALGIRPTGEA